MKKCSTVKLSTPPKDPDSLPELEVLTNLRFSPCGNFLAAGNAGGVVLIYKKEGKTFNHIASFAHNYKSLSFIASEDVDRKTRVLEWVPSRSQRQLLMSTNDATLRISRCAREMLFECESPSSTSMLDELEELKFPETKTKIDGYKVSHA